MKRYILLFFAICCCLFVILSPVQAANCGGSTSSSDYNYQSQAATCPPTVTQLGFILVAVIQTILTLSSIIFFFMVVVNGFNFATAIGDRERLESGRKGLLFSAIGFGLIFASFLILTLVASLSGIKNAGFSIQGGSIQFNILSPFNATPIPQPQVNPNGSPTSTP